MSGARFGLIALLLLLSSSCASHLPWNDAPPPDEVNVAFTVENNLLFLPGVAINGKKGRFFFGSATPRTVIDPRNVPLLGGENAKYLLNLSDRESIAITPAFLDLGSAGNALVGYDAFANRAVTIDYRAGLLTYQKAGIHSDSMTLFRFTSDPAIDVSVDGQPVTAIVDTSSPDTLVLPGGAKSTAARARVRVAIAGTDFGSVDVRYAAVDRARIGNRLLSKFLVAIDYRNHVVGLWRDPRIP